jgi:hypothetical protein
MTQPRTTKRPKGVPGVKVLLTAASLSATLGGWAALTAAEPAPAAPDPTPAPAAVAAVLPPLDLPVLPTLVPLVPPARNGGEAAAPTPVPTVAVARAPAPLRVVQAAPPAPAAPARPITRTRSSR